MKYKKNTNQKNQIRQVDNINKGDTTLSILGDFDIDINEPIVIEREM
jgi:hypothetical protein